MLNKVKPVRNLSPSKSGIERLETERGIVSNGLCRISIYIIFAPKITLLSPHGPFRHQTVYKV